MEAQVSCVKSVCFKESNLIQTEEKLLKKLLFWPCAPTNTLVHVNLHLKLINWKGFLNLLDLNWKMGNTLSCPERKIHTMKIYWISEIKLFCRVSPEGMYCHVPGKWGLQQTHQPRTDQTPNPLACYKVE